MGLFSDPLWALESRYREVLSSRINVEDPHLGYRPPAHYQARHQFFDGEKMIFDVEYKTDAFARRITPGDYQGRQKFALFMGCSFTWGQGVQAAQTVPYYFAQKFADYVPLNYGIGASGPHQFLRLLETKDLTQEVEQKEGVGIFYYIEEHIARSNGHSPSLSWLRNSPHYELNQQNQLQFQGSFEEDRSWKRNLTRLFTHLNGDFFQHRTFPPISETQGKKTCQMIKEMEGHFLRQFPRAQFLVLHHSMDELFPMKKCLEEKGIKVVAVTERLLQWPGQRGLIPGDGHPNALTNQEIINILAQSWPEKNQTPRSLLSRSPSKVRH